MSHIKMRMELQPCVTSQRRASPAFGAHVVDRVAKLRSQACFRHARPAFRCAAASVQPQENTAKDESRNGIKDENALFVATNNFKVKPEHCEDFENVWKKRDTHLKEFSGFIRFALLRCDDAGEYRSESFWENRKAFDNWRKSEQFTKSHKEVGAKEGGEQPKQQISTMDMLAGRPQPKFYEAVTVTE